MAKKRVTIDEDDYYPFYRVLKEERKYTIIALIDPRRVKRWERVMKEFSKVQNEMREAFESGEYLRRG